MDDFKSLSPFTPKLHVDSSLCDFVGENDISLSPSTSTSPFEISISMDSREDVSVIPNLPLPPVSL